MFRRGELEKRTRGEPCRRRKENREGEEEELTAKKNKRKWREGR